MNSKAEAAPLKVFVLDDKKDTEAEVARRIDAAAKEANVSITIVRADGKNQEELLRALEAVDPEDYNPDKWIESLAPYSDIDILFVDWRLRKLQNHPWLTGDDVALSLRLFAGVPSTVVINRFFDADFDLSLHQEAGCQADVYLNQKQLSRTGLWVAPPAGVEAKGRNPFRPWAWPVLPDLVHDVRLCREDLDRIDLDEKILPYFGFTESRCKSLTRAALGCLDPLERFPEQATFLDFLRHGCVSAPRELREQLIANIGQPGTRRAAINLLASEVRHWLFRMVLGPQDVLIDPPHLAERMPWVLGGDLADKESWNETICFDAVRGIKPEAARHAFEKQHWLSRPSLWLDAIQSDADVMALYSDNYIAPEEAHVFLEDISSFELEDNAEDFLSDYSSVWAKRHVRLDSVDGDDPVYAPKSRIA
ncbi:MAG TPA: hypothetical protein VK196_13155 [Magnetospirillum sp.]|nr:hypothetical protein [Magnetospirillum sp.]